MRRNRATFVTIGASLMPNRAIRRFLGAAFVPLLAACSFGSAEQPPAMTTYVPHVVKRSATTQFLYVYDTGSPGLSSGEYVRYSLSKLRNLETTAADGLGTPEVFGGNGMPYFVDEVARGTGFALFSQPVKKHAVAAKQLFYGIPCQANAVAIGPDGNFYVVQYCSANVLEYTPTVKNSKPKKPIARFTGGNLGQGGLTNPTYAVVDPSGNLYVGDNAAGVTYFPGGSTSGTVAFPTGNGGAVNQMIVDSNGDVWSIHGPNPSNVYFHDRTHCVLDPNGTIARNEVAERFHNGTLVQQLYTAPTDNKLFSDNGVSIAVDSSGRVYTGNQNSDMPGVLMDYDPENSCPDTSLSFAVGDGSNPQVAVDANGFFYVSNYTAHTISVYDGGTTTRVKKITQTTDLVNIRSIAIGP